MSLGFSLAGVATPKPAKVDLAPEQASNLLILVVQWRLQGKVCDRWFLIQVNPKHLPKPCLRSPVRDDIETACSILHAVFLQSRQDQSGPSALTTDIKKFAAMLVQVIRSAV